MSQLHWCKLTIFGTLHRELTQSCLSCKPIKRITRSKFRCNKELERRLLPLKMTMVNAKWLIFIQATVEFISFKFVTVSVNFLSYGMKVTTLPKNVAAKQNYRPEKVANPVIRLSIQDLNNDQATKNA